MKSDEMHQLMVMGARPPPALQWRSFWRLRPDSEIPPSAHIWGMGMG